MIADLLRALADLYTIVLLARVVMSWLPVDPENPVVRVLVLLTEPVLAPIRSVLPALGGIDFSPFVALLILQLLIRALAGM